ncbi:MAG: hypothetical protein NC307_11440 [Roseburia sp.]|nr:hypothetical protein [Roseburia sp.]
MITKKEMEPILAKIEDSVMDNFIKDQQTMLKNLELEVFSRLPKDQTLSDNMKDAIRLSALVIMEACNSVCISHDAAVIRAVMDYIRKSL